MFFSLCIVIRIIVLKVWGVWRKKEEEGKMETDEG